MTDKRLLAEAFMADLIEFRHDVKNQTQAKETGSDFMVIARAQDRATLKAVGEWLEGTCEHYPPVPKSKVFRKGMRRRECPDCLKALKEALKEGRMP